MRILRVEIANYRSLRHVVLDDLGPFVVLYGKNGAGKSNLIEGIRTAFEVFRVCRSQGHARLRHTANILDEDDIHRRARGGEVRFDLTLLVGASEYRLLASLPLDRSNGTWTLNGQPVREKEPVLDQILDRGFHLVPAVREASRAHGDSRQDPRELLTVGRVEEALYFAQSSHDIQVRGAFKSLKSLLRGAPLHRPDFDAVRYPDGRYGLRENWDITSGVDMPLELSGLGIVQVYLVLSHILLSGSPVVGLEGPEAHLHAPTSGRHLRVLLQRLVEEPAFPVSQLFVATHSNLFDLDPHGYLDVSRDAKGGTVVRKRPRWELYGQHLYEPGPALEALRGMLEYLPGDTPVFEGREGPVTADEMMRKLLDDDEDALSFLRDLHDAAVRTVRARHQQG